MVKAIEVFMSKLQEGLSSVAGEIDADTRSIDNVGGMIQYEETDGIIESFIADKLRHPNDEWERAIFGAASTKTVEYCLNTILTNTDDFDLDREAASVEQDLKLDEMKFLDFNV